HTDKVERALLIERPALLVLARLAREEPPGHRNAQSVVTRRAPQGQAERVVLTAPRLRDYEVAMVAVGVQRQHALPRQARGFVAGMAEHAVLPVTKPQQHQGPSSRTCGNVTPRDTSA